jgi:hypothetical protein
MHVAPGMLGSAMSSTQVSSKLLTGKQQKQAQAAEALITTHAAAKQPCHDD